MNTENYKIGTCKGCSKVDTEKVDIYRFITKLDSFFQTNDLAGAGKHLNYWEQEAKALGDNAGLLTVLNEEIGYYRRTGEREQALRAVEEATELLKSTELINNPSGAVICINIATTLNAFGKAEEGIPLYEQAEKIYLAQGMENTYEYAALLNNKATALSNLKQYKQAEESIERAISILKTDGTHDGEIAVSLVNLAHLFYDNDDTAVEKVEKALDLAWEYINSPNQPHDANYAFILSKCAPSYRYFNREIEANALEKVSAEIYGGEK